MNTNTKRRDGDQVSQKVITFDWVILFHKFLYIFNLNYLTIELKKSYWINQVYKFL